MTLCCTSPHWCFCLLLPVLLLLHCTSANKWVADRLDEDIYFWLSNEAKCIRLSTIHNRTGCATFNDGMHAQLRYVDNTTTGLQLLHANPSKYPVAIVMPLSFLATNLLNAFAQNLSAINGIIFLQDSDSDESLKPPTFLSDGYSSDSTSPVHYLRPASHAFPYAWNPTGTDNNLREYPFAMVVVSGTQSARIKQWAQINEANLARGQFASQWVEFTYPMYARNDTQRCLGRDNCLPVGGYSVWSTFQEYGVNASQAHDEHVQSSSRLIVATAQLDSACLFHQNVCRGGNANMAGLVGWLAAIEALSHVRHLLHAYDNETTATPQHNQIVFAAFQGESFELVGSRKFVHDLQNGSFECDERMNAGTGYGCWQPYASSMDFKKLNFSQIDAVVELSQIGMAHHDEQTQKLDRTIYAHYERNGNPTMRARNADMIEFAQWIAGNISTEQSMGYEVQAANSSALPGTPPSSYWSFLNAASREIPGIVFSDHAEAYRNRFYHSVFDSYYNSLNVEQICMTATMYARLLYGLALDDRNATRMARLINADCLLVEQLLECLLLDRSCDLVSHVAPSARDASPSQYTGVYQIIEDDDIDGVSKFVFRFVANLTRKTASTTFGTCSSNLDCAGKGYVCGGTSHGQFCMDSKTYFHSAVDTNLEFDYDSKRWSVRDNASTLVFAESMWNKNIGTRFYEKESEQTQFVMFGSGILMLALNMLLTWRFHIYCKLKFPSL